MYDSNEVFRRNFLGTCTSAVPGSFQAPIYLVFLPSIEVVVSTDLVAPRCSSPVHAGVLR